MELQGIFIAGCMGRFLFHAECVVRRTAVGIFTFDIYTALGVADYLFDVLNFLYGRIVDLCDDKALADACTHHFA